MIFLWGFLGTCFHFQLTLQKLKMTDFLRNRKIKLQTCLEETEKLTTESTLQQRAPCYAMASFTNRFPDKPIALLFCAPRKLMMLVHIHLPK